MMLMDKLKVYKLKAQSTMFYFIFKECPYLTLLEPLVLLCPDSCVPGARQDTNRSCPQALITFNDRCTCDTNAGSMMAQLSRVRQQYCFSRSKMRIGQQADMKYPAGVPFCHIFYHRLMCKYINKAGVEMSQSEILMTKGQNSRCEALCGALRVFISAISKDVLKLQLLNKVHFIMCINYKEISLFVAIYSNSSQL